MGKSDLVHYIQGNEISEKQMKKIDKEISKDIKA